MEGGTQVKSELSKKNPYWIDRKRYNELRYFCLQYPDWKKMYDSIDLIPSNQLKEIITSVEFSNPTYIHAEARDWYRSRMKTVETSALLADNFLKDFILLCVTEGRSYDYLKARLNIPCCRDNFYSTYRKFFWILDKKRG